jgi:hypothetical protein
VITKTKRLLVSTSLAVAVFLLPVLFTAVPDPGRTGYFDGGRCACGHPIYIRVSNDGYWTYSPGHDVSEHRSYALRPNTNGWDIIRVSDPRYDEVYIQMAPTGVVGQAWIEKAELCERWGASQRVMRFSRIYNPWPIWWAKLINE